MDYNKTFCPVVKMESFRMLIALVVQFGLKLHQADITTAFLNGKLEEEVYMVQPKGYIKPSEEQLVCKLSKSIYGLKQSPQCWNTALNTQLKSMGSSSDQCIYTKCSGGEVFFLGVHVDDIILADQNEARIKEVKDSLSQKFNVKDLGKLHYFLGIQVNQDENGNVSVSQSSYTENVLRKFGMQDCKAASTPVDPSVKLTKASDEDECVNQQLYQSAIGSLMYFSLSTQPYITYAVSVLAKFSSKPTNQHWTALKRVMRYLKGTVNFGILYSRNFSIGYSDADWAGNLDDRRSTSGYLFKISGGAISWRSKKQQCVILSTAEAEYLALANAAQEAVWLRRLSTDLQNTQESPTKMYEDNQPAIAMSKNPQIHGRYKHINIKYFIRELIDNKTITLKYCQTNDMIADIFTKGLSPREILQTKITGWTY